MPRTCTICRHPDRAAIEADLRAGITYRDVARRHKISKDALSRHWARHVSIHTAPVFAAITKVMALLNEAETAANWSANILTIREARRHLEEPGDAPRLGSAIVPPDVNAETRNCHDRDRDDRN